MSWLKIFTDVIPCKFGGALAVVTYAEFFVAHARSSRHGHPGMTGNALR